MEKYDAIIILGGGVRKDGTMPTWTLRRIKKALEFKNHTKYFITTSAYTTNKPPIIDKTGFPVNESIKMGELLVKAGIDQSRILTERWSHDTIGNAYFSRIIHTDQLKLKNILVVTSQFHMPRTQAVFEKVFSLNNSWLNPYTLVFAAASDSGLRSEVIKPRIEKENRSLEKFNLIKKNISDLKTLHDWLFQEHGAYTLKITPDNNSTEVLKSY